MMAESMAPPRRDQATPINAARRQWHRVDSYIRGELTWNRLYRATSYARSALWIVPFVSILLVLLIAPLLRWLDTWLGWRLSGLGVAGATTLYQTIISLTLSFLVFTFGSLLVAVQIAGGQLTPRIIATTLLRDNVVRYSVGLFVFALIFSVMALDRLEGRVHEIVALVTATLGIASIATFLFLIDYSARLLRPVSIVSRVGDEGLAVIKQVYPTPAGQVDEGEPADATLPDAPRRVMAHEGRSEIVLAARSPDAGTRGANGPAASSSSCRASAISWRATSRCSCFSAAPRAFPIARSARRWRSVRSGPWSRTRCLPSASWSTSR